MVNNGKRLTEVGRFRMTKKELERVERECEKLGITVSEFYRSAVTKKRIRLKPETKFNQDFANVRSDFDTIVAHINTGEKIDLFVLEELAKISQKLDRILDAS